MYLLRCDLNLSYSKDILRISIMVKSQWHAIFSYKDIGLNLRLKGKQPSDL